jgi:hypothetical protein
MLISEQPYGGSGEEGELTILWTIRNIEGSFTSVILGTGVDSQIPLGREVRSRSWRRRHGPGSREW